MRRITAASLLIPALSLFPGTGRAEAPPRTLVLALDGVPFRVVKRAREQGAFRDWADPVPLVSTFPSMTNVAFTAMFQPFGSAAAKGYEIHHYDRELNHIVGGVLFNYKKRRSPWRDHFDVTGRSVGSKIGTYTRPRSDVWKSVTKTERLLVHERQDLVFAHAGATDVLVHLRGEKAVLHFLLDLDDRLEELKRVTAEREGRALRVILLSDHGNTNEKVRNVKGLRRSLRKAGFRVKKKLARPGDVVAPTFGMVNYGALFLAPEDAEGAARAIVGHESVELAAWKSAPGRIEVLSPEGSGTLRWIGRPDGLRFAYSFEESDPLSLEAALSELRRGGAVDAAGFAHDDDWLRVTASGRFPDAPRRLVDALTGPFVENHATVIFSMRPGHAWGWKSARFLAWLTGGRLEGTHGGLDRDSTIGFFMTDDPEIAPGGPVRADRALAALGP